MKLAKDDIIAALRLRYDHYSAQSIYEATLARANLTDQPEFDDKALTAFRAALTKIGDRLENVEARLASLIDAQGPQKVEPPAPAPKAEAKVEAKTEVKVEAAAEAKPEKKKKDKSKETDEDVVETTIALAGVSVGDGEQVLVCGGAADLGDWDPERARKMKREGDTWLTTIRVPRNSEVSFKFLRRAADGTVTWEAGDNRNLEAKPRFEATWR